MTNSWLWRVQFEVEDKDFDASKEKVDKNGRRAASKSLLQDEFIVAETFKDVYERVGRQSSETFELVQIKKEVPIISIIPENEENTDV